MHLIIYFSGTGENGSSFGTNLDTYQYIEDPKVKVIIVKGCHDKETCNSGLFPNLSAFAKRFVKKLFNETKTTTSSHIHLATPNLEKLKIGIASGYDLILRKDGVFNYQLKISDRMDETQPDKGEMMICAGENGSLNYRVITPENKQVAGNIRQNELKQLLKDESESSYNAFFKSLQEKNLENLSHRFLPSILRITSKRNHTHAASWDDQFLMSVGQDDAIIYSVVTPRGESVTGSINKQTLLDQLGDRYNAFLIALKNNDLSKLELFFPEILKITSKINHTRSLNMFTPEEVKEEITDISLCGYSRGAVTCFNIAKELNKLAPHIPINIIANQPVPGNCYQGPGTNASSVADCSHLKNLQKATIILGAYTGELSSKKLDRIHRGFFSQILPKLPRNKIFKREIIVIPKEHHNEWPPRVPRGDAHLHRQMAQYLNSSTNINAGIAYDTKKPVLFPKISSLQSIFGLKKTELYHYIDKSHPSHHLQIRKGMQLGPKEKLMDWWKKQDKEASFKSSDLTKELVKKIQAMNSPPKITDLLEIFEEADNWLIVKDGSGSSRYYQVLALRDNLYSLLLSKDVSKEDIDQILYDHLKDSHYFEKHWQKLSRAASWFKTPETQILDKAFKTYSENPEKLPDKENDKRILLAMDDWLDKKKKQGNNKSKRFDLVTRIYENLSEISKRVYPENEKRFTAPRP